MFLIHNSAQFLANVVEPDYQDAMHHRESVRHAFHFVVGLFSLRDWVLNEFSKEPGWHYGKDEAAFQKTLEGICPKFALIGDVANSAKHLSLRRSKTGAVYGADHVRIFGGSGFGGFGPLGSGPFRPLR